MAVAHFNYKLPESKVSSLQERAKDEGRPFLEQSLQEGARKLLQAAIENEVIDYIQFHKDWRDEDGQRLVVRNGHPVNVTLLT
jgi:putative transposase